MDNFVALILLFHGLSIGGLIWAIKASIRRAMFKRTMKTLNAAVQSIPPELYDAAGIALTAAGVPGGTAIAGGVKSLAGSLPNPEDPAAKKTQGNNDKKQNGKSTELLGKAVKMFGDYGKNIGGKDGNLGIAKSKEDLASGALKVAGGTALMGAELSGKALKKAGQFTGKKIIAGAKLLDNMYGISTGVNVMGVRAKKRIKSFAHLFGRKVYTPAKNLAKNKIIDPTKNFANRINNSRFVTGARGFAKKQTLRAKKGIAAVGMATTITAHGLKMWREDKIDPKIKIAKKYMQEATAKLGKAASQTRGYKISQNGLTELKQSVKKLGERKMFKGKGTLKKGKKALDTKQKLLQNEALQMFRNSYLNSATMNRQRRLEIAALKRQMNNTNYANNFNIDYLKLSELTAERIAAIHARRKKKREKEGKNPSAIRGVAKVATGSALMGGQVALKGIKYFGKGIGRKIDQKFAISQSVNDLKQTIKGSKFGQKVSKDIKKVRAVKGRIKEAAKKTKGYEIRKEGKRQLNAHPISAKAFFMNSLKAAKGTLSESYENALIRREQRKLLKEQARLIRAANTVNSGILSSNMGKKVNPVRYVATQPNFVVVNNQKNVKPDVNIRINDTTLDNIYNLRNVHYSIKSSPVINTQSLVKAIHEPKNAGMSTRQVMTYSQAVNRLIEREVSSGNIMPNSFEMNEKEKFIRKAIMRAPGLTPDQAIAVSEKVIKEKEKRENEARRNAAIQVYNNRDHEEENRRTIERLIQENPEIESNLNDYIDAYYGNPISETRKQEIYQQAEQIVGGQVQNLEDTISSERLRTILNDSNLNTPEKKAEALAKEMINIEEETERDSVKELFIDKMAEDINGMVTTEVFNTQELQGKLSEGLRENDTKAEQEVAKIINANMEKERQEFIHNHPEYKEDASPYRIAVEVEDQKETVILEEAIKSVAPDVEIKQRQQESMSSSKEKERVTQIHHAEPQKENAESIQTNTISSQERKREVNQTARVTAQERKAESNQTATVTVQERKAGSNQTATVTAQERKAGSNQTARVTAQERKVEPKQTSSVTAQERKVEPNQTATVAAQERKARTRSNSTKNEEQSGVTQTRRTTQRRTNASRKNENSGPIQMYNSSSQAVEGQTEPIRIYRPRSQNGQKKPA